MKFRAALGFFTRLPVGSAPLPPTFQGVIVWLPAIGLIVGLLAALAVALATLLLPAQLGGVISTAWRTAATASSWKPLRNGGWKS